MNFEIGVSSDSARENINLEGCFVEPERSRFQASLLRSSLEKSAVFAVQVFNIKFSDVFAWTKENEGWLMSQQQKSENWNLSEEQIEIWRV